jgi:hypothetical protein
MLYVTLKLYFDYLLSDLQIQESELSCNDWLCNSVQFQITFLFKHLALNIIIMCVISNTNTC